MKKALDQTVRELKREVNKKVLKVPGIEQKILDATSNEPWGPHGSLLSDIALATRNYHEYQIIMHVIWKRLNDTGKNWRHVYKALTVLEYMVGHGSERVIDEIREHAYQISTLSDFQYIDSSGKDQGNNVRRKSQILVSLVNDKEKIQEVRQKALANKDKYRATFSSSGSYRPSSNSFGSGYGDRYDDDRYENRYGNRDDERNGYGRERDFSYKDDDRSTRVGDFYRDDDRYGRDTDENFRRVSFKDDDHRGGQASDDHQIGQRNMSFDKEKDHSYEDDDSYAYRNGGRTNDASPNERNLERKLSEQSVDAPPSYESAVRNDRDGGVERTAVSNPLSPAANKASSPQSTIQDHHNAIDRVNSSTIGTDDNSFDEFDPRGFMPAANLVPPTTSSATLAASGSDIDLFANSSSFDPVNSLALVLSSPIASNETEVVTSNSPFGTNFVALSSASIALSQPTEDPFGDAPFKATPVENPPNHHQKPVPTASTAPLPPTTSSTPVAEPVPLNLDPSVGFEYGDSLGGLTFLPTVPNGSQTFPDQALPVPELSLPQPTNVAMGALLGPSNVPITSAAYGHSSFPMSGPISAVPLQESQPVGSTNFQTPNTTFLPQLGPSTPQLTPSAMQPVHPTVQMNVPAAPLNYPQQTGLSSLATQLATNPVSGSSTAKQSNEKFETKSTVWADTLNRGLVNLNISGPKTNPLADIGVDFDSINRMERRKEKEKSSANPLSSTVSMGKAMGSGSGIGRTGGGVLSQPARPAVGSGLGAGMGVMGGGAAMGMGMVGPGGMGMGMGGYGGGMNQPMGMGMGMGLGGAVRPPPGMQPTPGFPGAPYNSMTGMGGYGSQQPFGGGYR